jgi:hypothetical protein
LDGAVEQAANNTIQERRGKSGERRVKRGEGRGKREEGRVERGEWRVERGEWKEGEFVRFIFCLD